MTLKGKKIDQQEFIRLWQEDVRPVKEWCRDLDLSLRDANRYVAALRTLGIELRNRSGSPGATKTDAHKRNTRLALIRGLDTAIIRKRLVAWERKVSDYRTVLAERGELS